MYIQKYRIEYLNENTWKPVLTATNADKIKIHRFDRKWGNKIRMLIDQFSEAPSIAEFAVFNERKQ